MSARVKDGRRARELPLAVRPAFRREFLDFERGIRMGNLEPNQRITQIVKHHLVARHDQPFLIQKWGRGRYWRWICWLPRANRDAKPFSSAYIFSCAKFCISLNRSERELVSGLQIERASVRRGPGPAKDVCLADDWDWHRLVKGLRKGTALATELQRLIAREGFAAKAGPFSGLTEFRGSRWGGAAAMRKVCRAIPDDQWGGLQLYYPIPATELGAMTGSEIVAAVLAIFDEVTPTMNLVMQEPYLKERRRP